MSSSCWRKAVQPAGVTDGGGNLVRQLEKFCCPTGSPPHPPRFARHPLRRPDCSSIREIPTPAYTLVRNAMSLKLITKQPLHFFRWRGCPIAEFVIFSFLYGFGHTGSRKSASNIDQLLHNPTVDFQIVFEFLVIQVRFIPLFKRRVHIDHFRHQLSILGN